MTKDGNLWTTGIGSNIIENTLEVDGRNIIVLCSDIVPSDWIIPIIITLLEMGQSVIYRPIECSNECYVNLLTQKSKNMDIVFNPLLKNSLNIFRPQINLEQPIYFSKSNINSSICKFLMMFSNLQELSSYLLNDSYQFISLNRVGYYFKKSSLKDNNELLNRCGTNELIEESVIETIPEQELVEERSRLGRFGRSLRNKLTRTQQCVGKIGVDKNDIIDYIKGNCEFYDNLECILPDDL